MEITELENNPNIIYISEEEHRSEWTYEATKDFLKIYDEKTDMLDTGIISTQKKLWELTSKALAKNGYNYTPAQCENKWKALKRSYRSKLERVQRFGTSKRSFPFEYEVAEIISKRPNENFSRTYSVKIDRLKQQEDIFQVNLNEPPGFAKDKTTIKPAYTDVKDIPLMDLETSKQEFENDEPTYTVIQEDGQSTLAEELCSLKNAILKHNKVNTQTLKQANEVQEKILECLERSLEIQNEAHKIEEVKVQQQSEIVQQMKVQNELLEKLIEKLC